MMVTQMVNKARCTIRADAKTARPIRSGALVGYESKSLFCISSYIEAA
jgi:hypothetical protein